MADSSTPPRAAMRLELLRLAAQSTGDLREALSLAQELEAFVNGAPSETSRPAPPLTMAAADSEPHRSERPVEQPSNKSKREKTHWTAEENERAAALLDNGVSYTEVGRILGRTAKAVSDRRNRGLLPVKSHRVNPHQQLAGALGALARGLKVSPQVEAELFKQGDK